MYQTVIVKTVKQFGSLVGGVIIHHDDIKLKTRLLSQSTLHGIHDSLLTVIYGDDHRCLDLKLLFVEVRTAIESGINLRPNGSEMSRRRMFHLYLNLAVTRVDIVELFHSRCPEVGLFFGIQTLVDVEYLSLTTQEQTERIESGILIVVFSCQHRKGMQERGLHQPETSEIEVVADTSGEIVYYGVSCTVGIYHCSIGITRHTEHSDQGTLT